MNSRRCIFSPPGLEIRLRKALHDILLRSWRYELGQITADRSHRRPSQCGRHVRSRWKRTHVARSMLEDQAGRRAMSEDASDFIS